MANISEEVEEIDEEKMESPRLSRKRRYEEISSGEIGARLDLIDFSRLRFQSADEETIDTKSVKKRELMKVTKRKMNKVKSKEPEISQTLLMVQKKESNKRRKRKNPSKTLYLNNPACQRFTKTRNYISKSKL